MRKYFSQILIAVLALAMVAVPAAAEETFSIGVEGGYFVPADDDFNDIYGGNMIFGVNLGVMLSSKLKLEVAGDTFSADSTTAITQQDINLSLMMVRLGGYYLFDMGEVTPKLGAGLSYTSLDEETPFGDFSDSGIGWFIGAGADMKLSEKIKFGVELLYNDVSISGDFGDESVGGFAFVMILSFLF